MDKIASQTLQERSYIFQETANARGVASPIIEKDFWVCWTLKRLFELPDIAPNLIFKGGTSLSKVYKVIERFSEDIDVSINREYLGFAGELDPINIEGTNRRRKAVDEIKEACQRKIKDELLTQLEESFTAKIGPGDWSLSIDEHDTDRQTILFQFPISNESTSTQGLRYVKPIIRIELGARAEHQPSEKHVIMPYAAEVFPKVFENPSCEIKVLAAERTFWEKATILHDQYHRSETDRTAQRVSRHYYDLYKLSMTPIAEQAIANRDLLANVIENKKTFFTRAGAKYDEALGGKLHLVPNDVRLPALKADYEQMGEMFFSDPPKLETIVDRLKELEAEINEQYST